jgi:DNA-binding transcriptional LysR family regulator
MDTLRAMHTFVRAVELGSLSAAAREQSTGQPAVSKLVAGLERQLGVRLLERTTTRLVPTEEGRRFLERAKRVLEEFHEAVTEVRGSRHAPSGLLRVNAPLALGELRLNALVLEFLALYPDIEVELILNDRFVDLAEEGVDVALRLGGALPPQVVARKLGTSPRGLVASPAYLERAGRPRRPQDLSSHQLLRFAWATSGDVVELSGPDGPLQVAAGGRYRINSSIAIREALLKDAGIAMAPAWLVQDLLDERRLVRVLPRWHGMPQDAFVLYPPRRYQPLRARVFIEFLGDRVVRIPGFQGVDSRLVTAPGDTPTKRLNARLNAASDW